MAIVYFDVGTGKTHATAQAGINAVPGNLFGLGEQRVRIYSGGVHVGDMYRYDEDLNMDAGFANESLADFVSLDGMVSHTGLRDTGIVINGQAGAPARVIICGPYSKVRGVGITSSVINQNLYGIYSLHTETRIENCVVYGLNAGLGNLKVYGMFILDPGARQIQNCAVMDLTSSGLVRGIYVRDGTSRIYNCSVLNLDGSTDRGIVVRDTAATITNCVVGGMGGGCFSREAGANPTVTYCISSDDTADDWGGAGNQINKDPDTDVMFTDTTSGTDDIHIQRSSCAIDAGTDLTGQGFDDDISEYVRPYGSAWDVGAVEYNVLVGITPDLRWVEEDDMFNVALNPKLEDMITDDMPVTDPVSGKYRIRKDIALPAGGIDRRPPDSILDNLKDGHSYKYRLDTGDKGSVFVVGSFSPESEKKSTRIFLDNHKRRLDR